MEENLAVLVGASQETPSPDAEEDEASVEANLRARWAIRQAINLVETHIRANLQRPDLRKDLITPMIETFSQEEPIAPDPLTAFSQEIN